jgi:Smr domain
MYFFGGGVQFPVAFGALFFPPLCNHPHTHTSHRTYPRTHTHTFPPSPPRGRQNHVTVDLHLLTVEQALNLIESMLSYHGRTKNKEIRFITGRGSHSEGGVAKIKIATQQYLRAQGYRFRVGVGAVVVTT